MRGASSPGHRVRGQSIGISGPAGRKLREPALRAALKPVARYIAPYDVMDDPIQYERLVS